MTYNRREFIEKGTMSITALSALSMTASAKQNKAAEVVELGNSGLLVSRLGFGVGDGRNKDYEKMGQEKFNILIRLAIDNGVRYFDTDGSYIHSMLAKALEGVDRSKYTIIAGIRPKDPEEIPTLVPRFLQEFNTDYIDGILIISISRKGWAEEFKPLRDMLSEAKEQGRVKACGVSVHGYEGLKTLSKNTWVDFAMVSCNHLGNYMDAPEGIEATAQERHDYSVPVIKEMLDAGKGVVSMKTFSADGLGSKEERAKSIQHNLDLGIHGMPIKFRFKEELDEVLKIMSTL